MLRRTDLLFPMEEYERRLNDLRHRMGAQGVEALLVTDPEGMHYLTTYQTIGYYYFQALVVPLEGEPFMVVRLLEETNVTTRTWIEHCRPYMDTEDPMEKLFHALEEFGLDKVRIGYDRKGYFFRTHEQEKLFALCPNAKFIECSGLVEAGRLIKSDYEIELMRKAAFAAEAGMEAGIKAVTAGASENDVAADIHYAMYKAGGQYPALSPFVASGPRCLIGHATWEGRIIQANDCVMLEIGGCVQRYHAAMMRTVYVGEHHQSRLRKRSPLCWKPFRLRLTRFSRALPPSRPMPSIGPSLQVTPLEQDRPLARATPLALALRRTGVKAIFSVFNREKPACWNRI
jgi:Xaa-Pro dipeptidase